MSIVSNNTSNLTSLQNYKNVSPIITKTHKSTSNNIDNYNVLLKNDIVSISDEARSMQLEMNSSAIASMSSFIDTAKSWASSTLSWLKKAGEFALDAAQAGLDFLVLDDIKTIFDPNSSTTNKGVALVSLFPAGKVVKTGKLYELLKKAGKSGDADAFAGLGKIQKYNSKGILLDGKSDTGWDHIYKRHISGSAATEGTTLFPKALGEAQIKNLIMESLEKGTLKSTYPDGRKVYSYNPQKYGISEMITVVTKDNIIKSSYPVSGTAVRKYNPNDPQPV